jgi:thiol:disulfide interchange protein DsbC
MIVGTALAHANEAEMLTALRASLVQKPTVIRQTLLPGLYRFNVSPQEIGPRAFVDREMSILGNMVTGYAHFSGPKRGQDLTPQEAGQLFRQFLTAIPKERLVTYHFGNGAKEVLLFSAYDCPSCRKLEQELLRQQAKLNATVYIVPTALDFYGNPNAASNLKGVLCAPDKAAAWARLILKRQTSTFTNCNENPEDYVDLHVLFPVKFPTSVPTAVTLDGRINNRVLASFDQLFR